MKRFIPFGSLILSLSLPICAAFADSANPPTPAPPQPPIQATLAVKMNFRDYRDCREKMRELKKATASIQGSSSSANGLTDLSDMEVYCRSLFPLANEITAKGACRQIIQACEMVGMQKGMWKHGNGLYRDCVNPIIQGQPYNAALPLPSVDPAVVAACRATHPNFGEGQVGSNCPTPTKAVNFLCPAKAKNPVWDTTKCQWTCQ